MKILFSRSNISFITIRKLGNEIFKQKFYDLILNF